MRFYNNDIYADNDNPLPNENPRIIRIAVNGFDPKLAEYLPEEIQKAIMHDLERTNGSISPFTQEKKQEEEPKPCKKISFDYKMVNCNQDLKDLIKKLKTSKVTQWNMLLYGQPGCHAKGEKVLAYDGTTINVEDVKIGDKLMGPDSKPREVLELIRGKDKMYKISINNDRESMIVNENHILSLQCLSKKYGDLNRHKRKTIERPWSNKFYEMSVKEYLNLPNSQFKRSLRLYFPENGIDFKQKHKYGNLPPYLLGLLLGDGCLRKILAVSTADNEIADYIKNMAKKTNLLLTEHKKPNNKAIDYYFVNKHTQGGIQVQFCERPISKELGQLGLWNTTSANKFIPNLYLTGTKKERLELLAGLLDADGCLVKTHKVLKSGKKQTYYTYDFTTKSYQLFIDVKKLCRSLGFKLNIPKFKTMKKLANNKYVICNSVEKELEFYRLTISGKITKIPVKVKRKKAQKDNELKEGLKTAFTIKELSEDNYYGFKLDKDHLYLMDNYLVTHNCGKSHLAQYISQELKMPFIKKRCSDIQSKFVGESERNIRDMFVEAKEKKAILCLDECDSFLYDRTNAQREFEVSSVNELLTQLEEHPYPVILSTNLKTKIDRATLRRCLFKIKFEYMTKDNIKAGIKTYFGKDFSLTDEQLKELKYITAGDFKVAKQKMDILENSVYTNKSIFEYLKKEQDEKEVIEASTSINL